MIKELVDTNHLFLLLLHKSTTKMANYHIIETGNFFADGGAMFGPIPKKYWSRRYPSDENNLCVMAMRCMFIETDTHKVLIDCGGGDKHHDRLKFYAPHNLNDLRDEIAKLGYSPDEVTDVVLSHLHFDHCGGGTVFDNSGNAVPAFPRATYHLSQAQWDNYRNPRPYEKDSFFADNIEPVFEAGQLNLIESDTSIAHNIRLKLYNGHTPGQIAVFFDNDGDTVIYPGDVIPTAAHLSLGWISAFDNNAALAMEEKIRLLDEAKPLNATLMFYHDVKVREKRV